MRGISETEPERERGTANPAQQLPLRRFLRRQHRLACAGIDGVQPVAGSRGPYSHQFGQSPHQHHPLKTDQYPRKNLNLGIKHTEHHRQKAARITTHFGGRSQSTPKRPAAPDRTGGFRLSSSHSHPVATIQTWPSQNSTVDESAPGAKLGCQQMFATRSSFRPVFAVTQR